MTISRIKRDAGEEKCTLYCKNNRIVQFSLDKSAAWNLGFLRVLKNLAFPGKSLTTTSFVYTRGNAYMDSFEGYNGWRIYDTVAEFKRQGALDEPFKWRLFLNGYSMVPTYPHTLIIPSKFTDEMLADVAKFRSKARVPAVTWYHKRTGGVMARASQPLVGLAGGRCAADEYLCNLYRLNGKTESELMYESERIRPLYIVDARSVIAAEGNRMRKGGIEKASNYAYSDLIYLNIDNIHTMRESLYRVSQACEPYSDDSTFNEKIEASHWIHHIRLLLKGALRMAEILGKSRFSLFLLYFFY